jgi:putative ABC transport system substrate-binding protein
MNVTEAQTTTINQVGILSPWDANGEKDVWDAFKDGLTELGYPEGKGVTFVSRFADGNFDRLTAFAAELVQLGVDVIVPATPPPIKAAKSATSTIPIVFPVGSDPVELGLVLSYERPGGNVTGVATMSWKLSRPRLALRRNHSAPGERCLSVNLPGHGISSRLGRHHQDRKHLA